MVIMQYNTLNGVKEKKKEEFFTSLFLQRLSDWVWSSHCLYASIDVVWVSFSRSTPTDLKNTDFFFRKFEELGKFVKKIPLRQVLWNKAGF